MKTVPMYLNINIRTTKIIHEEMLYTWVNIQCCCLPHWSIIVHNCTNNSDMSLNKKYLDVTGKISLYLWTHRYTSQEKRDNKWNFTMWYHLVSYDKIQITEKVWDLKSLDVKWLGWNGKFIEEQILPINHIWTHFSPTSLDLVVVLVSP